MPFKSLFFSLLLALSGPLAASERLLVCLGDSLTAGLGLNEEQAYPALIQKPLAALSPPWRVVNAGVSGDTSAGGLKRLDWVLRSHPDAIFIALGANDGLRGLDPQTTEANLRAAIQKSKAGGARVFLAGLDLPSNLGSGYRSEFKAVFPRVAKAEGVPLLGFLLEGVGGQPSLNLADGMHPNETGHIKVAAHVLAFLEPKLKALPFKAAVNASAPKVLRHRNALEGQP